LLVADTYNHKVKIVDPAARSVHTILGNGKPATKTQAGGPAFFEPGGLCVAGDDLFVADTNNHRVIQLNLKTHKWCELILEGLSSPSQAHQSDARMVLAQEVSLAADREIELILDVRLPENAHLLSEAPWSIRVGSNGTVLSQQTEKSDSFPLRTTISAPAVRPGDWNVEISFVYCTNDAASRCIPCSMAWKVPIKIPGKSGQITLSGSA
jgi:hypothetical protein